MNERHANIFQTHFVAIQNRLRCELSSCRNFRFTCLVIDWRHYALNSNDLRAWNAAINKGEATIHSPPVHLHPKPSHISKKRKHEPDIHQILKNTHRNDRTVTTGNQESTITYTKDIQRIQKPLLYRLLHPLAV